MISNMKTKKMMVRFALEEEHVGLSDEGQRWFTSEECRIFKEQARRSAKAWKNFGYGGVLKHTFDNNPKPPATQNLINKYAKHAAYSQRGLERWINTQHCKGRDQCKTECIKKVLTFQKKMKRRDVRIDVVERELARVSMSHSRHAKIFARRIGKADALVALEEHSSQKYTTFEVVEKKRGENEHGGRTVHFKMERWRKPSYDYLRVE